MYFRNLDGIDIRHAGYGKFAYLLDNLFLLQQLTFRDALAFTSTCLLGRLERQLLFPFRDSPDPRRRPNGIRGIRSAAFLLEALGGFSDCALARSRRAWFLCLPRASRFAGPDRRESADECGKSADEQRADYHSPASRQSDAKGECDGRTRASDRDSGSASCAAT